MPRKNHLTLKIILFLFSIDIFETITQFCFKKAAITGSEFLITSPQDLFIFIKTVSFSPFLWIGFIAVLAIFISWSVALSRIDLSVAVPICSLSYITIPLVSIFFLHEEVTWLDWTGILFIIIGVIMISMSTRKQNKEAELKCSQI